MRIVIERLQRRYLAWAAVAFVATAVAVAAIRYWPQQAAPDAPVLPIPPFPVMIEPMKLPPEPPASPPDNAEAPKLAAADAPAAPEDVKTAPAPEPAQIFAEPPKPVAPEPAVVAAEIAQPVIAPPIAAAPQPSPDPANVAAPAEIPAPRRVAALALAPDPALIEQGRHGKLPTIAPDGKRPWQAYARPFDVTDTRPRLALVAVGLGLAARETEAAIQKLPPEVTLAFSPYANGLERWMAQAREAGHETLLAVPMEPADYPLSDPGPQTLLTTLTAEENLDRLEFVLSRAAGYVGVVTHRGEKFTTTAVALRPALERLQKRGLLLLDSRASTGSVAAETARGLRLPALTADRTIEADAQRFAVDIHLAALEQFTASNGRAVAIVQPGPAALDRVAEWSQTLGRKGVALAPLSAMISPNFRP